MPDPGDEIAAYFAHVCALRSDDPTVRRPAIAGLFELARQGSATAKLYAERVLKAEFGPYAVADGLSGCAGSVEAVQACCAEDRDCRCCPWVWLEQKSAAESACYD